MKVKANSLYPNSSKLEWAVSFTDISLDEFAAIMLWKEECAPISFVGYATSKVSITMFITDEKEYSLALLRWM